MTIHAALAWGRRQLRSHSTSPELDSQVLLGFILGRDTVSLVAQGHESLTAYQEVDFRDLIAKRQDGSPVAYLTGQQEFFGRKFAVTPDVLIPRPATELMVEALIKKLPKETNAVIADVGTGSGAIAVTLAHQLPDARVVASDVSPSALLVAKKNAQVHDVHHRITWLEGSLLQPHMRIPRVDVVIANLPYLTDAQMSESSIAKEPKLALHGGHQGLELIWQLIDQLPQIDPFLGVALEMDPSQVELVAAQLSAHWPNHKLTIIDDGQSARGVLLWKS